MARTTIAREKSETKLETAARVWLNRKGQGYDNGAAGAYADLMHGGCSSGIVSDLVYTADCERFAVRHIRDIMALWQELTEEMGERPMPRDGADLDLNWLAWFGFEEAARRVASRAGIE